MLDAGKRRHTKKRRKKERHPLIISKLNKNITVRISELAIPFGVTTETVPRERMELGRKGPLNRRKRKMIRGCKDSDFNAIFEIVNDAAQGYKGIIPADRWHEPYMDMDELRREIEDGVVFWGLEHDGQLLGVMGIQDKSGVTLIRHAYVRTTSQKQGIGRKLLNHLESMTENPVLIGTWADADWAISFYKKNGYTMVSTEEKNRLLHQYWSIPDRQVETSVVLANPKWCEDHRKQ